jgi:hypothetical protein
MWQAHRTKVRADNMTSAGTADHDGSADRHEHDTVMWEVRAAPTRLADVVAWAHGVAIPALLEEKGCLRVDVFDAADERVVVIARFDGPAARLPEPPADLLRRPPHTWSFRHVSAHTP